MKILVVDDERAQRDTLCRGLRFLGHRCVSAANAMEAMERLDERPFDLLLTDLTMPGESGLQLIERARRTHPDLRALVITGLLSTDELRSARALGIPILRKPFNPDQLQAAINKLTIPHPGGCR